MNEAAGLGETAVGRMARAVGLGEKAIRHMAKAVGLVGKANDLVRAEESRGRIMGNPVLPCIDGLRLGVSVGEKGSVAWH
jgi:hypothetical protein